MPNFLPAVSCLSPMPVLCHSELQRGTDGGSRWLLPPDHSALPWKLLSCSTAGPPPHSTQVAFVPLPRPKSLLCQLPAGAVVVRGAGRITPTPGRCGVVYSCRENVHRTGWWRADCALVPVIIAICYFPVSWAAEETHKASQV